MTQVRAADPDLRDAIVRNGSEAIFYKRKVDFSVFVWALTLLGAAMITVAGYLFQEVISLREQLAAVRGAYDTQRDADRDARQALRESIIRLEAQVVNLQQRGTTGSAITPTPPPR